MITKKKKAADKEQNLMTFYTNDRCYKKIERALKQIKKTKPKFARSKFLRDFVQSEYFDKFIAEYK